MFKKMFKKTKQPCKYWRWCMDFRRSKDICHEGEQVYCGTYQRLNKKEKKE
jgi:DNA polymerase III psi subunit